MPIDRTFYDEDTLTRAQDALQRAGWSTTAQEEAINVLLNAEFLIREHPGENPADREAEEPVPARQSIHVACEVNLPLGTVTEALTVLQDVPITATLALRYPVGYDTTAPIHSESRGPHIVIRWEEHR